MKICPPDREGIAAALDVVRSGGVVAHATETCYGLACDLRNPDAVLKLFQIKQRPLNQPVSALFASVDDAKKFVEWNDKAQKLADEFLPGPLTLILPMKTGAGLFPVPSPSPSPTIGIRVSSHAIATELVRDFTSPLSTTSANIHGQPNPYSPADMIGQFERKEFMPDLILDSGILPQTPPSTIINLTGSGGDILRRGSLEMPKK